MDVEKLKKMNDLSKELKRHGIAIDNTDAFARAGEIVRDKEVSEIISHTEKTASCEHSFDKQYQLMLERQNRQIANEISALKETVAALKEEILHLKQAKPTQQPQQAQQQPKQETQTKFPQKAESKEHPRQGSYTPDDVAVDKIFYFGKK